MKSGTSLNYHGAKLPLSRGIQPLMGALKCVPELAEELYFRGALVAVGGCCARGRSGILRAVKHRHSYAAEADPENYREKTPHALVCLAEPPGDTAEHP